MPKRIIISEQIWKEGGMYTSYCPELDVASCGRTVDEARKNLREALEIFIEETSKMGTLKDLLEEAGYDLSSEEEILIKRKELVEFETVQVPLDESGYAKCDYCRNEYRFKGEIIETTNKKTNTEVIYDKR